LSHISFSELKIWEECSYKHKLSYIDKISTFNGNEHTAFGKAVHSVCEAKLLNPNIDEKALFKEKFLEEVLALSDEIKEDLDKSFVKQLQEQGSRLVPVVLPGLIGHFGKEFELISVEEQLLEPIEEFPKDYDFKGFIDLVIKTPDGKYHIIDWKTCSWGWKAERKSDTITTYQLTLYKHFFAKKHNIDCKNIKTHFALLKRARANDQVEIFEVTSGNIKTNNAINLLTKALYNIDKKNCVKNRLACKTPFGWCEFYKTKHCK
tara:strand:- start:584 stop:1372 length:789 start_codon:yes stop_codon:yes gene_type:complete